MTEEPKKRSSTKRYRSKGAGPEPAAQEAAQEHPAPTKATPHGSAPTHPAAAKPAKKKQAAKAGSSPAPPAASATDSVEAAAAPAPAPEPDREDGDRAAFGKGLLLAAFIALVVFGGLALYAFAWAPHRPQAVPPASMYPAALGGKRPIKVRVINGDDKKPVADIGVGRFAVSVAAQRALIRQAGQSTGSSRTSVNGAAMGEGGTAFAADPGSALSTTDASGTATVYAADGERLRAWKPAWLEGAARVRAGQQTVEIVTYRWAYQWPKFGYDDARTNNDMWFTVTPPYKLAWKYNAKTLLEYPVSAYKGKIVGTTGRGRIFCLNARNGRELWRHQIKGIFAAEPALDGLHAYVSAMDGHVYCLRMTDGKVLWKFDTGGPVESSPVLDDGHVYVGSWNRSFFCIARDTGRKVWEFRTGGAIKGTGAVWQERIYFGSYDGSLYCVDKKRGDLVWRAFIGGTVYSSPAIDVQTKKIYVGSTAGYLTCLNAANGHELWKFTTRNTHYGVYSSPALGQGRVFFGSYDGIFYACDAVTGKLDWTFDGKGEVSGSPAIVGYLVYVASFGGHAWALNTHTGKMVWEFPDGRYTPATANGEFLFIAGHHHLYAYTGKRKYT